MSTSLHFVTGKDNWEPDRPAVLSPFSTYHHSSHISLLHPLCSFLLFPSQVVLLSPYSRHFPTSPSCLSSSCFSYRFASHPRGDSEQWIYSKCRMLKREQCFKKKHWHGLYYHQLCSTSQLCPRCPSFCVTVIWLVKWFSNTSSVDCSNCIGSAQQHSLSPSVIGDKDTGHRQSYIRYEWHRLPSVALKGIGNQRLGCFEKEETV